VRQEAWALLLVHNMTATIAARAAGQTGIDPRLIPFTAVLSLIRAHVTAGTCCSYCGRRPASGSDPTALLVSQVLAHPAHRDRRARISGRTAFQRWHWHTEEITFTTTIVPSNLPKYVPGVKGSRVGPGGSLLSVKAGYGETGAVGKPAASAKS
jgi:hypothetical protein